MEHTSTPDLTGYMLGRLDTIRDTQVRLEVLIEEMLKLLKAQPATVAPAPTTVAEIVASRLPKWLFSLKPLGMAAGVASRQTINAMVIIYMARGGSLGPMEPYIKYLLGIQ